MTYEFKDKDEAWRIVANMQHMITSMYDKDITWTSMGEALLLMFLYTGPEAFCLEDDDLVCQIIKFRDMVLGGEECPPWFKNHPDSADTTIFNSYLTPENKTQAEEQERKRFESLSEREQFYEMFEDGYIGDGVRVEDLNLSDERPNNG